MHDNIYTLYLWMLLAHNCLISTSQNAPKLRYRVPASRTEPTPAFQKITDNIDIHAYCIHGC